MIQSLYLSMCLLVLHSPSVAVVTAISQGGDCLMMMKGWTHEEMAASYTTTTTTTTYRTAATTPPIATASTITSATEDDSQSSPCGVLASLDKFDQQCGDLESSSLWVPTLTSTVDSCSPMLVNTTGSTCKAWCNAGGLECARAQDNVDATCSLDGRHDRQDQSDNGCNQEWNNQICQCAPPATTTTTTTTTEAPSCGALASLDKFDQECGNLESSQLWVPTLMSTIDACYPMLVNTSGSTCKAWCNAAGLECARAQDNVHAECSLDSRHDRQDQSDNGCNQVWKNQICQCAQ